MAVTAVKGERKTERIVLKAPPWGGWGVKVSGGTSYSVTVPMEYVRKLKWRAKQKLEVKLDQDRIIIRDWKG